MPDIPTHSAFATFAAPALAELLASPLRGHGLGGPDGAFVMTANTRRMLQALHPMPERTAQTVAALFRKYDCTLPG